jgi:hypothetical protein
MSTANVFTPEALFCEKVTFSRINSHSYRIYKFNILSINFDKILTTLNTVCVAEHAKSGRFVFAFDLLFLCKASAPAGAGRLVLRY